MHLRQLMLINALFAAGCASGKPVDIGENTSAKTGEKLSDYAASWDGYAEAYNLPSGSDRVRMTLDEHGNGTVKLGEDVDYGAPQADVGYAAPAGFNELNPVPVLTQALAEGFAYSAIAATVQDERLQFGADGNELYQSWCELQTDYPPNPATPGEDTCEPSSGFGWDGSECLVSPNGDSILSAPIDCYKAALCEQPGQPCTCTSAGCTVLLETTLAQAPNRVDGALSDGGDSFTGTLVLKIDEYNESRITIHLTRQ